MLGLKLLSKAQKLSLKTHLTRTLAVKTIGLPGESIFQVKSEPNKVLWPQCLNEQIGLTPYRPQNPKGSLKIWAKYSMVLPTLIECLC